MASTSLIDYVVAHELCHLEHLNHFKAFWKRLEQIMPYKILQPPELSSITKIKFNLEPQGVEVYELIVGEH